MLADVLDKCGAPRCPHCRGQFSGKMSMNLHCFFIFFALMLLQDVMASEDIGIEVTPEKVMETLSIQKELLMKYVNSLEDDGILVANQSIGKEEGKTEKITGVDLLVRKLDSGLLAKSDSRGMVIYVCNDGYNAMLTKRVQSPNAIKNPSKIDLPTLRNASMSMISFSKPTPSWMDRMYPDAITHTYFSFGGGLIQNQYSAWVASGGTLSSLPSKTQNCVDLVFDGWPTSTGPLTITVDAEGTIHQMQGTFKISPINYRVEEFTLIDGVKIPQKVVIQYSRINSDSKSETKSSWSRIALSDVGFDPKQFYVNYYGLPEPNLELIPKQDWTLPRLAILMLTLVLAGGVYYAIRRKTP